MPQSSMAPGMAPFSGAPAVSSAPGMPPHSDAGPSSAMRPGGPGMPPSGGDSAPGPPPPGGVAPPPAGAPGPMMPGGPPYRGPTPFSVAGGPGAPVSSAGGEMPPASGAAGPPQHPGMPPHMPGAMPPGMHPGMHPGQPGMSPYGQPGFPGGPRPGMAPQMGGQFGPRPGPGPGGMYGPRPGMVGPRPPLTMEQRHAVQFELQQVQQRLQHLYNMPPAPQHQQPVSVVPATAAGPVRQPRASSDELGRLHAGRDCGVTAPLAVSGRRGYIRLGSPRSPVYGCIRSRRWTFTVSHWPPVPALMVPGAGCPVIAVV